VVEDSAGNLGEFSLSLNVEPAVTVAIEAPAEGDALSVTTTIEAAVTAQAAIANVEFYVDGQLLDTLTHQPYQTEWLVEDEDLGAHDLKVIVNDAAGNHAEDQLSVNVIEPIRVAFTDLEDGDVLRGAPEIVVQVDAQFPIDEVVILVDGEELGSFIAPPYQAEWPLYNVEPGQYVVSAVARDIDGHEAQVEVTVDVNQAGVNVGEGDEGTDSSTVPGAEETPSGSNFGLWFAIIAALALAGVLIPLALRKRRGVAGGAPEGKAALHELQGHDPGKIWPLGAEMRLGRKRDENDIHIKGRSASRRMAIIRADQNGYTLYNLSPNNPAVVNGTPVAQQIVLRHGDLVQLGESQFKFEA